LIHGSPSRWGYRPTANAGEVQAHYLRCSPISRSSFQGRATHYKPVENRRRQRNCRIWGGLGFESLGGSIEACLMPHSVLLPFVARFTEILATHPVSVMIWQRLSGSRYGMKILSLIDFPCVTMYPHYLLLLRSLVDKSQTQCVIYRYLYF